MAFDVLIVGGGPAGLSAALVLGRSCRDVVLCDEGAPAHAVSEAVHGMLTRDGIPPAELRRLAHAELAGYPSVALRRARVERVTPSGSTFTAELDDGSTLTSRRVLLAHGVRYELPALPGIEELWGRSVFHCPYCDGWEVRASALAVYGPGPKPLKQALMLRALADDVVLLCDGQRPLDHDELARLRRAGVTIEERPVAGLVGDAGRLTAIRFEDGQELARDALFIRNELSPTSAIPEQLGCAFDDPETITADETRATSVAGVYAAGDNSLPVSSVLLASASGARAAQAIHASLVDEDLA